MKRQNQLNIKRGLLSKLVLLVALFLGSSNAWGEAKKLPYNYDLESKSLVDEDWTSYNLYNGGFSYNVSQRYNSASYAHASSYSFRFYGSSGYTQYLISPNIETSPTGILVSFYCYAPATSMAQTRTFSVGYSTTDNQYTSFEGSYKDYSVTFEKSATAEWKLITTKIAASNAKYVAIKYTSSGTSYFDDFHFEAQSQYKNPTNFALSSFSENTATFTWEKGSNEEAFQLQYIVTGETTDSITVNLGNVLTTTLYGLTKDTEYKAKLRSKYDDDGVHYSAWTDEISFTPRSELVTIVNDGTSTNAYVPFSGSSAGNNIRSQFIIPASSLEEHEDRQITKLVFHSSYESTSWGTAKFEVYIKENSEADFSTNTFYSWGTTVYNSASLSVSDSKMEIILDTPFNYSGGNLMIGFKLTAKGSASYTPFYGVNVATNTAASGYGIPETIELKQFLPKITITSTAISTDPVQMDDNGYTTYASPRPLDLTAENLPSGLKAYKAEVNAGEGKVIFTEINQTVPANTGILLAGTANKTYNIPVADSGDPVGDNAFLVNSTGGTFDGDDKYTYFGFKKNSDPITFATFNPSTVAIPSNKAYLKVKTSELPAEARQLVAVFDDGETTSLREIRNEELGIKNAVFFNLNGQRVAQPTKGLYIVNGKKVLVP